MGLYECGVTKDPNNSLLAKEEQQQKTALAQILALGLDELSPRVLAGGRSAWNSVALSPTATQILNPSTVATTSKIWQT